MPTKQEGPEMPRREREKEDAPPLTDSYVTPVYTKGLLSAYVDDGLVHLAFFVDQPSISGEGKERIANLRLIMPVDSIPKARDMVNDAIGTAEVRRVMDS